MKRNATKGSSDQRRDPLLATFASSRKKPFAAVAALKTQRTSRQAKAVIEQIRLYHVDAALYGNRKVRN